MKTPLLSVLALSTFCSCAAQAQNIGDKVDPPPFGGDFYSMAFPDYPPLPFFPAGLDIYYLGTNDFGFSGYAYDDREFYSRNYSQNSVDPPPVPGGGDSGGPDYFPPEPFYDWTTNHTDLWIWLDSYTNAGDGMTCFFTIHNTSNGLPYEIISCTNVSAPMNPTNWNSEGVWLATSTNLSAYVPMGGKTNQNFFRGHLWTDFTFGIPTNGQVFMQSVTNNIYPVVNGVTNHLIPFWSNWFVLNPRPTNLYALNLGYAAEDFGFANSIVNTNPPQQILRFVGFSKTITNLCLSSNLLTTLNVSGWPALQDVEAWHNTNMLTVYVTNCPQLRRACFEAIQDVSTIGITNVLDFSGCIHLEEIRAADNRFPNVIITNGAGPEVWHLCFHNNNLYNQLPSNFNFTVFPSLRELWVWNNVFAGALPLQNSISTNLVSVEAFNNKFTSLDVSGQTNLDHITMYGNITMTNVNISGCNKVREIDLSLNGLSQAAVDHVLITLDQSGSRTVGSSLFATLDQGTNAVPSLDGQRAFFNLLSKTWTVTINPLPTGTPHISSVGVPAVGSNSVTITWTTDIASDSAVYYSTTFSTAGASYSFTNVAGSVTSHSVTVTGLTAAANYYFFVRSTSGGLTGTSGDYQFTTRGGPGIYFVHTSTNVVMQVATNGSPSITWLWADGTATVGAAAAGHGFTNAGISSVVVKPESALTGFGLYCGGTGGPTTLDNVTGLTNYPNLQELHLYQSGLTNVSLAGCSNLVSIALVLTSPSSEVENGWFNDIWDAQHTLPGGTTHFSSCGNTRYWFYFPASPGTNATSAVACSNLVRLSWNLYHN